MTTPQASRQARSSGSSRGTGTAWEWCTTTCSANAAVRRPWAISSPPARSQRAPLVEREARLAQRRLAAAAGVAGPARAHQRDDDVIAGPQLAGLAAHLLDDARGLVPVDRGHAPAPGARGVGDVAVAHGAGRDAHAHLVRPRRVELDLLDDERLAERVAHGCLHASDYRKREQAPPRLAADHGRDVVDRANAVRGCRAANSIQEAGGIMRSFRRCRYSPLDTDEALDSSRAPPAMSFRGGAGLQSSRMTTTPTQAGEAPRTLLAAARQGDEDAFRSLVEPHRGELHAHCYRMLGSVHDAEDALQDALLRAWRGLPRFEGRSSLRIWLYRIATNTCLNAIARRPKRVLPIGYGPAARSARRRRASRSSSRSGSSRIPTRSSASRTASRRPRRATSGARASSSRSSRRCSCCRRASARS